MLSQFDWHLRIMLLDVLGKDRSEKHHTFLQCRTKFNSVRSESLASSSIAGSCIYRGRKRRKNKMLFQKSHLLLVILMQYY